MPYDSVINRGDAQALMPEEVSSEIIKDAAQTSAALRTFRQIPMSRAQRRMPVLNALATAYWVSGDTGLKQTTELDWTNQYINAEEIAVIVPIPENVLDDAEFDMWAEIRPQLTEAVGKVVDEAILFGVNKPASWTADGIVPAATAAGNFITRAALSATNDLAIEISNAMGLVELDGFMPNGFLARVNIRSELRSLRDQNRGLLYQPSLATGQPNTLYGDNLEYVKNGSWPTSGANKPELISGDFRAGIIGMRKDITYKILTEAVITDNLGNVVFNLAQQDMVALRLVLRLGWTVANPKTRLNPTDATRYPFAIVRSAT